MPDKTKDRRLIELKYRIMWRIGTVIAFLLYFSGIMAIYTFVRWRCFKQYIAIVLMYHRVGDNSHEPDMTVSNSNFDCQMRYIKENYKISSLDEILDLYISGSTLTEDTIAITFDDGHRDNYINAYPILRKYDIPASIFVAINFVGQPFGLTKEEILTMRKDKITFGAHTMTHRVLADLDKHSASLEIKGSKSALEQILGEDVKYFAYPYGLRGRDFTVESVQIVRETGFTAAFTTNNGYIDRSNDIFMLKRIGVRNIPLFVLKCRLSGIFENRFIHILRRCAGV